MNFQKISRMLQGQGLTTFQIQVLINLCKVPKGKTITYKELARISGRPKAFRAVGTTMRKNPFPITIPCHRVVKSDGSIGNYSGIGGKARKLELLRLEKAL